MAKGPRGERRTGDVIGAAIMGAKIATGEIEDNWQAEGDPNPAAELGWKGGKARAAKMTPERRAEIARKAAAKRWGRSSG